MDNVQHMCRVVEDYIYHRKDKRVKISIQQADIGKLVIAYQHAMSWFNLNRV